MQILHSYIKIHLSFILNEPFTHAWFQNIMYWLFRKYSFTESLCRSFKWWLTLLYSMKKITLISISISSEKPLLLRKCEVYSGYKFSKKCFFLESSNFIIGNIYCPLFSLKWSILLFLRICLPFLRILLRIE